MGTVDLSKQSSDTPGDIPTSAAAGSAPGSSAPAGSSPKSCGSCEKPSGDSNSSWPMPGNVRQFASQVNAVATMLLNGDIDIETARAYSALARTVAQAVSAEMTRAKLCHDAPNMDL